MSEMTEEEKKAFAEKVRSLSFSTGASRSTHHSDEQLSKDMDAYKRLRANGEQPPTIRGAANLETRASSTNEITAGKIVTDDRARRHADKIIAESKAQP